MEIKNKKKKEELKKKIEELAEKYPEKIKRIKKFIENKKNHKLVKEYYEGYFKRYKENDWKEQLRILFVMALSSGRGGNIDAKAESIEKFYKKVQDMNKKTYKEFLRVFNAKGYPELFEKFKSKDYPQIRGKTSALFLRDIFYFKDKIIQGVPNLKEKFIVPVDRVIIRTVNSIFNTGYKKDVNERSFEGINSLAEKIFKNKPILLEDLWFWGRFYRCKEAKKKGSKKKKGNPPPYCKFNKNLLIVDANVTEEYRKKLLEFGEKDKNKKCPFIEICFNPRKLKP